MTPRSERWKQGRGRRGKNRAEEPRAPGLAGVTCLGRSRACTLAWLEVSGAFGVTPATPASPPHNPSMLQVCLQQWNWTLQFLLPLP